MTTRSPILNSMDDEVFRALADANRRTLLDFLMETARRWAEQA